mmetsp:Transcript_58541/g.153288  ORF Transcript_58541/g.153288 Transcript_58541/m.153288 type:complete len:221 (+) Transcript_58541:1201-1863(+)
MLGPSGEPGLQNQQTEAPNAENDLQDVHPDRSLPPDQLQHGTDRAVVEDGECVVLGGFAEGSHELRADEIRHLANPYAHIPDRSQLRVGPLGVPRRGVEGLHVEIPMAVGHVDREAISRWIESVLKPLVEIHRRETHPGRQRMPSLTLALRGFSKRVEKRVGGLGAIREHLRQIADLHKLRQLVRTQAFLVVPPGQEGWDAFRLLVDEDQQGLWRQRGDL